MNFKGYHDVVASSLAAPSVGGAVHPGFGDMFLRQLDFIASTLQA